MKKILFTSYSGIPNKNIGGGNRIIAEIISNLSFEEYATYYFSDYLNDITQLPSIFNSKLENKISKRKILGDKIFKSSSIYRLITLSQLYQQFFLYRIHRKFRKMSPRANEFDYVHAHDTLSAAIFSYVENKKKILSIHSKGSFYTDLEDRFCSNQNIKNWILKLQKIEKSNFLNSDEVTFPSKAAQLIFYKDLNIIDDGSKNIRIIYNGIDLNSIQKINPDGVFSKFNINQNKYDLILVNVATHSNLKNIDQVIRATSILKLSFQFNPLLINVGTGYQTNNLLKLTKDLDLTENIEFLGNISNSDVIRIMKSSDLFIILSQKVIFDMVLLEAIACGIPVIASNDGGNKEIIKNGVNGFLVNKSNLEEIVNKIVECNKRNLKNSQILLDKKFTSSYMTLQYQKLYND